MKIKEFFYLLGIKPRARTFGFTVESHHLEREGQVDVARWLHHRAYRVAPSQAAVDQLRRFLRPGDVALDIGAHVGDTAIPIALAVGPTGTVLAFEPNPNVFGVLEKNASLNAGTTHIVPYPFAAMRHDGRCEFQYGEPGYCNGGYHEGLSRWRHASAFTLEVEGRNLQDFLRRTHPDLIERIRFIKVDTEGFDLAVLETLEELLQRQRPVLHVEMFDLKHEPPGYRQQLYRYLVDHQYAVYRVDGDDNYFGDLITPENLTSWRSYDVCCVPAEYRTSITGL
jgi:FkbM family methyltransferase